MNGTGLLVKFTTKFIESGKCLTGRFSHCAGRPTKLILLHLDPKSSPEAGFMHRWEAHS